MDVSLDSAGSSLTDLREVPLADVAAAMSPELLGLVQRSIPRGADQKQSPVSAFNSSI
jgi:FXSXX-COOH protein